MKKRKAKFIKDPKKRGEWVESVFVARASELGLPVSKPWGDSESYDFVVGRPGKFVGVQVKSTTIENGGGYVCVIRKQGGAYTRGSFDFVAAYVVPEDVWYIIPVKDIRGRENMSLCSNSPRNENEKYREAWNLLREAAELGEQSVGGEKSVDGETGVSESVLRESGPGGASATGSTGSTPAVGRFPRNAVDRMEAAANFARRYLEGNYPRPQKEQEKYRGR
jgi:hypothetical protein